jgi:PTS system cellobiose-specific IIB component
MSSSLVESHLLQATEDAGLPPELRSMSVFEMEQTEVRPDMVGAILVAPQVRFLRRGLESRARDLGVIMLPIDPMDFGMADGEAILRKLLAAAGEE